MDKATRSAIERATQQARRLLDVDFSEQLEGTFDVLRSGVIAPEAGAHLSARQQSQRGKIVAAIEHKIAAGADTVEAVTEYVRDAAFTTLNRFVALKMLEARQLVQECITRGEQSSGYKEFCGLAPGAGLLPDAAGYRLYIESLFDEFSTEIKVLFDRRDAASVLWPKRQTFETLLGLLNSADLSGVWSEDETIGWIYQFFNSDEERRVLRDKNPIPRNSRELAIRNQFFTPRYVVQFLVDNTLGRIWTDMYGDDSQLTDLCEYLRPADGETLQMRPRKDPRDIRVLDPACGSGHFLLYSFDLLIAIYEEAWSVAVAVESEATGKSLKDDYPDLDCLRSAIPRLIVEHNLYGVDIDPRCSQIAALALWLRAQRAWKDFGVVASERPRIQRTHIVVAEPIPHDAALLDEFAASLDLPLLGDLFKKMVAESRLAGVLGVLLRAEDAIASELRRAREQFVKARETTGFLPGLGPDPKQGAFDLSGIDDDEFFQEAEASLLEALRSFAERATGGANVRRRLFADDTAHGLALIDLLRTRFDVTLMNPPFGAPPSSSLDRLHPLDAGNLYAAFVRRARELGAAAVGCITDRTFITQATFDGFRNLLLSSDPRLTLLADLGWGVLDANVQVCAYVLAHNANEACAFIDAREHADKEKSLLPASPYWHWKNTDELTKLPDSVLAYSVPDSVLEKLTKWRRLADIADLPRGLGSNKASRTYLAWFEVATASLGADNRWAPLSNGGEYSPYWRQDLGVADWQSPNNGPWVEMLSSDNWRPYDQSGTHAYFKKGLSFPKQSSAFHVSVLPNGFLPTREGKAILPHDEEDILPLMSYLNSGVIRAFVRDTCGLHKQSGAIGRIPVPNWDEPIRNILRNAAQKLISISCASYCFDETSRNFLGPAELVRPEREVADRKEEIALIANEIDRICRSLFEISPEESSWLMPTAVPNFFEPSSLDTISWSVGVAFGRFDIRIVTGERSRPPKPDPFDLPQARSPGMLPLGEAPFVDCGGILVDDPGHPDDIIKRIESVYTKIGHNCPEEEELRRFIAQDFFSAHIKTYSKSRRKGPIYWQLATPSASYSVWIYTQSLSNDSLFRIQNDYVVPKLAHEQRQLEALRAEAGASPTSVQRKLIETQAALVDELTNFLNSVKQIAPLWSVDLDDSVIASFAPLWPLVSQNKPWQAELKSTWDNLVAGKLDWTHLSMRLWPERVVPNCAEDRSLAIAHGLVDKLWVKSESDKWRPASAREDIIKELIRERTSVAIKTALNELLGKAAIATPRTRTRRSA